MFNFFRLSGICPLLPSKPLPHIVCLCSHIRRSVSLPPSLPFFLRVGQQTLLASSTLLSLPLLPGWAESGKGQGAAKECGRFIFTQAAFFAWPEGLSHLGMSYADKPGEGGVTEICASNLQHPRCEPSSWSWDGGREHAGTLRSWDSPAPIALGPIPRMTSLMSLRSNVRH